MKLAEHVERIIKNNRTSMRECALMYRKAHQDGRLCFMVKWLILAETFRELNRGYREAL